MGAGLGAWGPPGLHWSVPFVAAVPDRHGSAMHPWPSRQCRLVSEAEPQRMAWGMDTAQGQHGDRTCSDLSRPQGLAAGCVRV